MDKKSKTRGQEYSVSGKFHTTKENQKLKTKPSLRKRTVSPHLLGSTVLCKTDAQKSPPWKISLVVADRNDN